MVSIDGKRGKNKRVKFSTMKRDLDNCVKPWQRELKNFCSENVGEGVCGFAGLRQKFILGWFFCTGIDIGLYFWIEKKLIIVSPYPSSNQELLLVRDIYRREMSRSVRVFSFGLREMDDELRIDLYKMIERANFYEGDNSKGMSSRTGFKEYLDEYFS